MNSNDNRKTPRNTPDDAFVERHHEFRPDEIADEIVDEMIDEIVEDIVDDREKSAQNSGLIVRSENRLVPKFRERPENIVPEASPKPRGKNGKDGPRIIIENAFPVVEHRREYLNRIPKQESEQEQGQQRKREKERKRKQEEKPEQEPPAHRPPRPWVREKKTTRRSDGTPPILEVRDLDVVFGEHPVLREISFEIGRGDTVAIIGESGCGKTVLLKTLIALLPPTRGTVLFDGKNLNALSERELTRQRTRYGFVFQQAALFDSMSIGENIAFPLRQHARRSEREMLDFVLRLIGEVGLPKSVLEKKPAELSGGMRKRVGFARALAMGPELMLYDEPTTGLDPIMSDVINELMLRARDIHDIGGILVTHDMDSAKKVADRIIMLYPYARLRPGESQMIFDGTPQEIERCSDRRVAQFLRGEAGERLFEGDWCG